MAMANESLLRIRLANPCYASQYISLCRHGKLMTIHSSFSSKAPNARELYDVHSRFLPHTLDMEIILHPKAAHE